MTRQRKTARNAAASTESPKASDFAYGWTTVDGGVERGGGPLVMRVEAPTEARESFRWRLLCHSWVEPVRVELDSGECSSLYLAQTQVFWSAYARMMSWLRNLTDDGAI